VGTPPAQRGVDEGVEAGPRDPDPRLGGDDPPGRPVPPDVDVGVQAEHGGWSSLGRFGRDLWWSGSRDELVGLFLGGWPADIPAGDSGVGDWVGPESAGRWSVVWGMSLKL
jgi:hypothetical protein